jgi:5-epi-alpha-selinene synthase
MAGILKPDLYCPFPSQMNPHVEALEEYSFNWAMNFRLVQGEAAIRRFRAAQYHRLSARTYPKAGLEELKLVNDWMVWLFMWDDQFDEAPAATPANQLDAILDGYRIILTNVATTSSQGPAANALQDLCRRTFWRMPPRWRSRFAQHCLQWLDSYAWTVNNCRLGIAPALDIYVEKRRHTGGMHLAFDLIDFSEHLGLPEPLRVSPPFEVLNRITNDLVCWSNDIFSLEKELARRDVNNLVIVLQQAERLTLQESVDQVHEMINAQVRLFEETERQLPSFGSALDHDVERYVRGLRAWIRGNMDWAAETPRFSQIEHTQAGQAPSYREDLLRPRGH